MAESKQSKQSPAEILAWSFIDYNLAAYQAYAADLAKGATVAGTTTTTTGGTLDFKAMLDKAVAALPAPLQPYGPAIILGGGALAVMMLLNSGSGRR
jgi:hypothetical protein